MAQPEITITVNPKAALETLQVLRDALRLIGLHCGKMEVELNDTADKLTEAIDGVTRIWKTQKIDQPGP